MKLTNSTISQNGDSQIRKQKEVLIPNLGVHGDPFSA
jgi:hypothetical protein